MLQAKTKEGQFVVLAMLNKTKIEWHRQHTTFYCPACQNKVIIKAGNKVTPHFAHIKQSTCPSSGGEGPYHEKGKLLLYEWLKKQSIHVNLEPYIAEIKQRPDLLANINYQQIAVEFQSAKISDAEIRKRNLCYRAIGIIPLWILGANHLRRIQKQALQLNEFILQCMHQFSPTMPITLYFLCPSTCQFLIFHSFYMATTRKAIGKLRFFHLFNLQLNDLVQKHGDTSVDLYRFWLNEKRILRLQPRGRSFGQERKWRQWLYEKRLHPQQLPSAIHLPVSRQYKMKTPPWNWQSRICLDVVHPLSSGSLFTLRQCKNVLCSQQFTSAHFPLLQSKQDPVKQYLQLLSRLKIIKQTATGEYKKLRPFRFYNYIEDALEGDLSTLQVLRTNKK
ncbi:competence protein CoiA [Virgibacillus sp. W0430]|uniref:competence protein CoiA n=1 Tax=Virgibacillus sp. W0430 TaxID=3391580 RepID=UPI003F461503